MLRLLLALGIFVVAAQASPPDLSEYHKNAVIYQRSMQIMGSVTETFYYADGQIFGFKHFAGDVVDRAMRMVKPQTIAQLVESARQVGFFEQRDEIHSLIPDVGGSDYVRVNAASEYARSDSSSQTNAAHTKLMYEIIGLSNSLWRPLLPEDKTK